MTHDGSTEPERPQPGEEPEPSTAPPPDGAGAPGGHTYPQPGEPDPGQPTYPQPGADSGYPPPPPPPGYGQQPPTYGYPGYGQQPYPQQPPPYGYPAYGYPAQVDPYAKSKLVAGLLGILVGGFGVHRFYLGYVGIGIIQIVVTLVTCGLGALWGLVEGILYLVGSNGFTADASGRPLRD